MYYYAIAAFQCVSRYTYIPCFSLKKKKKKIFCKSLQVRSKNAL